MKAFIPILLSVFFCLPLHAANVVADPFPPAHFTSLYIEKDVEGKATVIRLQDDTVIYQVSVDDKVLDTVTVHPAPEDWLKFIQGLNSAKVYKWAPKYYYPGRGPTWAISLAMDDRSFSSQGTNEYPKEGAESEPAANPKAGESIPFQIFWQAALQLVGKAPVPTPSK